MEQRSSSRSLSVPSGRGSRKRVRPPTAASSNFPTLPPGAARMGCNRKAAGSLTAACSGHYLPPAFPRLRAAGVAQLVEHLICNEVVGGSSPFASSFSLRPVRTPLRAPRGGAAASMAHGFSARATRAIDGLVGCPSGQREQTVNLPAYAFEGSNPSPTTIPTHQGVVTSGNSSAARASAFQAEGRGFESRFPLQLPPLRALPRRRSRT